MVTTLIVYVHQITELKDGHKENASKGARQLPVFPFLIQFRKMTDWFEFKNVFKKYATGWVSPMRSNNLS